MAKRAGKYSHRAMRASKSPAPTTDADVLVVRKGRVLLWPNGEVRGREGYAVSAADPFIDEYRAVLVGAKPGTKPAEITHPIYAAQLRRGVQKPAGKRGPRAKPDVEPVKVAIADADEDEDGGELPEATA